MVVTSIFQHPEPLERLIREIAEKSDAVNLPTRESGHLGDIGISRVFACLEEGTIHINPTPDEYQNIVCQLRLFTGGTNLYVDIAVDTTEKIIHVLHVEG